MIRAIGVGDNFVDRYVYKNTMYPGGNSVNFAVYSKMLGHESAYLGVLAEDREAHMITEAMDAFGVEYSMCPVLENGETGKGSIRLIDNDRVITDDNDNGSVKHTPLQLTKELLAYISGFDIIHSACYGFLENQLETLSSVGIPIAYDFSDDWSEEKLENISPRIDIALLSGGDHTEDELKSCLKISCDAGCEVAICTIGSKGAMAYDGNRYYTKMPYNRGGHPIVDTMGAGDSFLTGFVTTYIDGKKRLHGLLKEKLEECTTKADRSSYQEALIELGMNVGNAMAMKTCMTDGSFGRGEEIMGG